MKLTSVAFIFLSVIGISACCCLPSKPKTEKIVPIAQVIDEVKDQLYVYLANTSFVQAKTGVCYDGTTPMMLKPENVTLTLKTVTTDVNESTAGLAAPMGVISFDPTYSGSYLKSRTQTVVVPLTVVPLSDNNKNQPKSLENHPLAVAISQFRDEILAVNHDKKPCLQYSSDKANFKLSLAFDVVNKTTGGFGLKLAVFKLSDKQTAIEEAHQTLDIEFSLPNGSMMIK